jgi:vacuolar-type H+-ATPase subunit E/Vma4
MSGEALKREIRTEAEEKARKLLADAKESADKMIAEAEGRAREVLAQKLQESARNLDQLERAEEARSRMECSRSILTLQSRYFEEVFEEAEARLKSLPTKDPALYKSVLTNFMLEAAEGLEGAHLLAVVRDEDRTLVEGILKDFLKVRWKDGRKVTFSLSDESLDAAGGMLLHTDDMRTYFVNTFESRLLKTKTEERAKVLDSLQRAG